MASFVSLASCCSLLLPWLSKDFNEDIAWLLKLEKFSELAGMDGCAVAVAWVAWVAWSILADSARKLNGVLLPIGSTKFSRCKISQEAISVVNH